MQSEAHAFKRARSAGLRLRLIAWSVRRKFLVAGEVFLPALYAIWFRVKPLPAGNLDATEQPTGHETPLSASPSVATSAVSQRAAE